MRMYTDVLDKPDIGDACSIARAQGHDIYCDELMVTGSRSHARTIIFYCESLHGVRARNGRQGRAATWTAYGWVIAELFRRDPRARIGHYKDVAHFIECCRSEHDRHARYRPSDKSRQDISFLELVQ